MIRLSTRARYACRMLVFLASQTPNRPVRRQEIADVEEISIDYVEQILVKLKAGGLVRSHRGAKGGFSISCDPATTTIADVVAAMEGPISLVPCKDDKCPRMPRCALQPVWEKASQTLQQVLSEAKISDLAVQAETLRESQLISFQI